MATKKSRRHATRCLEQLGLTAGASPEEVRTAYRPLIRIWHPDRHLDDPRRAEEKSKELNAAFGVLKKLDVEQLAAVARPPRRRPRKAREQSNPQARRAGDSTPRATRSQAVDTRSWGRQEVAGRVPPKVTRRRGRDIIAAVQLTPEEAWYGARWQLALATCPDCAGWGAALGQPFHVCQDCRGLGADTASPASWLAPCGLCCGRGCFFEHACRRCAGSGESSRFVTRCRVDPGNGRAFFGILEGLGHPGARGAAAGNLYLISRNTPEGPSNSPSALSRLWTPGDFAMGSNSG